MFDPHVEKPDKIYGIECKNLVRSKNYILFTTNKFDIMLYGIPIYLSIGPYELSFHCKNCLDQVNLVYKNNNVNLSSNSKNSHFVIKPGRRYCIHPDCVADTCKNYIQLDISYFNLNSSDLGNNNPDALLKIDESDRPKKIFRDAKFKETYISTYPNYVESQIVEQIEIEPVQKKHARFRCKIPINETSLQDMIDAIIKIVHSLRIQGECIYTPYVLYFDICGKNDSLLDLFNNLSTRISTEIGEFEVETLVHRKEECGRFIIVDRS